MQFIDLAAQQKYLGTAIQHAIAKVLEHGKYILGPEVSELENRLSEFCDVKHVVTCANGTDALTLVLMAEGIGPGDAVFVPAFTFVASAEAPAQLGATPFFVDVEEGTFNISCESLKTAIVDARKQGLTPKAIIAVDLFGHPADYDQLKSICSENKMLLIADAAQSFGASLNGARVGTLADYTTTSFFPAKPLGCYGDGGAIMTNSEERSELLKSLRFHGKGGHKYDNVRIGLNSRLDTIQAAVLLEKLKVFDQELSRRQEIAERYSDDIKNNHIKVPQIVEGRTSAWAQYTLCVDNPENLMEKCEAAGVPTAVYYPIPLNKQVGYKNYPVVSSGVSVSGKLSKTVVSLPMHPYLETKDQDHIIGVVMS